MTASTEPTRSSSWPRRRSRTVALVFLWGVGAGACSPPSSRAVRPSLLDGLSLPAPHESPARWQYHPRQAGDVRFAAELEDGRRLFLGARGERWLAKDGESHAAVASAFAPERLIEALPSANGWLFAGESGAIYESRDPLSPFLRAQHPPDELIVVSMTETAVVGVTRRGALQRSTDSGATWTTVPIPGDVVDVQLLPSGHGLLLSVPERLMTTADHGVSWQELDVESFGVLGLKKETDSIRVRSVLGERAYFPARNDPWGPPPPEREQVRFDAPLILGPSASEVRAGRASFSGTHYIEIQNARESMELRTGPALGPLRSREVNGFRDCHDLKLSAFGDWIQVACAVTEDVQGRISFHASEDRGRTWTRHPFQADGDIERLTLTALPRGQFLVTGICPLKDSGPGCSLEGVHYFGLAEPEQEDETQAGEAKDTAPVPSLLPATLPSLRETPYAMDVSPDGRRVMALAARTKDDSLAVFVSRDGGRTFTASELPQLEVPLEHGGSTPLVSSFRIGADGYASAVVQDEFSTEQQLLLLDEEGRFISINVPPVAQATMAAVGLKALAVHFGEREAWETLDGGTSWAPIGTVPASECLEEECVLSCESPGCVVGEDLSRIGWGGQTAQNRGLRPRLSQPKPPKVRAVQSTAMCRFLPDSSWEWTKADGIPQASSAAIGTTAWFSHFTDYKDIRVDFLEMPKQSGTPLITRTLLSAVASPTGRALFTTPQIEGFAALRQTDGAGVELAWRDLFHDSGVRRITLGDEYRVRTEFGRYQVKRANPDKLTIGIGGIFFAPARGRVFFTDGQSIEALSNHAWPDRVMSGAEDLARAGSRNLAIRLMASGAAVAALPLGSRTEPLAFTLALPEPKHFDAEQDLQIAYTQGLPGVISIRYEQNGARASMFPFAESGPLFRAPIPVPTQADLGSVPVPCTERQRTTTPRVVANFLPGSRHAVLVSDPSEPIDTLVTRAAVLHGTPKDPCAVVFDATGFGKRTGDLVWALVSAEPTERSWLFKKPRDSADVPEFEYRAMSCTFDPHAEIPEEIYEVPGTER